MVNLPHHQPDRRQPIPSTTGWNVDIAICNLQLLPKTRVTLLSIHYYSLDNDFPFNFYATHRDLLLAVVCDRWAASFTVTVELWRLWVSASLLPVCPHLPSSQYGVRVHVWAKAKTRRERETAVRCTGGDLIMRCLIRYGGAWTPAGLLNVWIYRLLSRNEFIINTFDEEDGACDNISWIFLFRFIATCRKLNATGVLMAEVFWTYWHWIAFSWRKCTSSHPHSHRHHLQHDMIPLLRVILINIVCVWLPWASLIISSVLHFQYRLLLAFSLAAYSYDGGDNNYPSIIANFFFASELDGKQEGVIITAISVSMP